MSLEVMKQALEALETCMYPQQKQIQAITSLRQAIEQAEKQVCVACEGNPQGENIPCAICGAAPQPQREWVGLGEARGIVQAFLEKPTSARYSDAFMEGARWAEAKLKEKNT